MQIGSGRHFVTLTSSGNQIVYDVFGSLLRRFLNVSELAFVKLHKRFIKPRKLR